MKNLPKLLKYTLTHEWIKREENNTVRLGITDHAQESLGEIVFVELPALGKKVKKGEEICVLESVKAAADVYTPLSGEIIGVNSALISDPAPINSDPYKKGWLFQLKLSDFSELESLLTAENYEKQIAGEGH